nr:FecR domain-containing protein [uncultured Achromobacter sp.]
MTRADAAPVAAGQIDPAIVRRASQWMARLWSDSASDADLAACAQWRAAHPDHERAWSRLQVMDAKLGKAAGPGASRALLDAPSGGRRRALQALGLAVAAGGAALALRESGDWQAVLADHRSGTGEIREVSLPDGTRVVLNTRTAIDVRFDAGERRVILRRGEILVTTATDRAPAHRPFRVQSRQGMVQALGTRFTVRQEADLSQVAVFDGAVDVYPADAVGVDRGVVRVNSGQRTVFSAQRAEPPVAARESAAAWSRGVLVAENMRVADFLEELGRYRAGFLRCDPAVADWRVTGVFSVLDTDRALRNLMLGLPLAVNYRTPYWVTVHAKRPA